MNGFLDPQARPPQQDKTSRGRSRIADPVGLPSRMVPDGWVHLDSVDRNIVAQAAVADPLLAQLLTEDLCWAIAYAAWQDSTPVGRKDRSAWQLEGQALEWKRQRIVELAASFGIRPEPPTHPDWLDRVSRWLRPQS